MKQMSLQEYINEVCMFCRKIHDGYCDAPPKALKTVRILFTDGRVSIFSRVGEIYTAFEGKDGPCMFALFSGGQLHYFRPSSISRVIVGRT